MSKEKLVELMENVDKALRRSAAVKRTAKLVSIKCD